MRNICLVLFLIGVFASALRAQITFTAQDIGDAGTKIGYKTFQGTLPLGTAAADQTWDYTNQAQLPVTDTAEFLNPSTTLQGARFPQANIAILENGLMSYYRKANNGFFLEGIVLDLGGLIDETPIFRISPPLRIIQFPSTFGNTFNLNASSRFTFQYDTVVTVNIFGQNVSVTVDSVRVIATFTGTSAINGWGNLILPPGTSFPGLRQQVNQVTNFTVEVRALTFIGPRWVAFPVGLPRLTNNSIRYWTNGKNNSMLEITLDSANRPLNARFQPPTITNLETNSHIDNLQAIPNPFSASLRISGLDENDAFAQLLTIDGKVVATTSKAVFEPTNLLALRSGVYLLQLSDKTGIVRKRLKVMKE